MSLPIISADQRLTEKRGIKGCIFGKSGIGKTGDRKTVVFCSTAGHARNVADTFIAADVPAVLVYGEWSKAECKDALARFERGEAQVVVNVAVLTEGWGYPPANYVVLLRPSSFKSTLIQMIDRGLRTIDPKVYQGVAKTDCIVLDFGTSTLLHSSLEQDVNLDGRDFIGEVLQKECPAFGA